MEQIYHGSDTLVDIADFLRQYQERINEVIEAIPPTPTTNNSDSIVSCILCRSSMACA